jgi:hypothetical protein
VTPTGSDEMYETAASHAKPTQSALICMSPLVSRAMRVMS